MSTDAICTCSHGLGVLRHADDCPVAIERRQPVRLAALNALDDALAADAVYQRGFDHGRHRSAEDVVKFAEQVRGHTRDMLLKAARVALNGPDGALSAPSEPAAKTTGGWSGGGCPTCTPVVVPLTVPFSYFESANDVTLHVNSQGSDGLAFVAVPKRDPDGPYVQYGVVMPKDIAAVLARRMLATLEPPAAPSEPVPDGPRVWAGVELPAGGETREEWRVSGVSDDKVYGKDHHWERIYEERALADEHVDWLSRAYPDATATIHHRTIVTFTSEWSEVVEESTP